MNERAQRVIAECRLIAGFSEEPGRTTRRFLTPPVQDVHAHLRSRMESLGMSVSVDAVGNLRGLWRPANALNKRLVLGSHIDTVPNAGAFDGVLGVVLALEWVEIARDIKFPIPVEVIAFSEEEGVRYGVPFLGSRAVAGSFDECMLAYEDANGIRMDEAIRSFGLNSDEIPAAAIVPDEIYGFIEMHIEQGPVLEAENISLAVVQGIAGQSRFRLCFSGRANHAGTTPMNMRRDALAATAEWIGEVERLAQSAEDLVATVGQIELEPNAANVIPGRAVVSLDIRSMSDEERHCGVAQIKQIAATIAARRGIGFEWIEKMNQQSVVMDEKLATRLTSAVNAAGFPEKRMHSGAGHDAMVMAPCVPAAMLFLRSPGGISHHPDESVLEADVEACLQVGRKFLEQLAADLG